MDRVADSIEDWIGAQASDQFARCCILELIIEPGVLLKGFDLAQGDFHSTTRKTKIRSLQIAHLILGERPNLKTLTLPIAKNQRFVGGKLREPICMNSAQTPAKVILRSHIVVFGLPLRPSVLTHTETSR